MKLKYKTKTIKCFYCKGKGKIIVKWLWNKEIKDYLKKHKLRFDFSGRF